MADKGLDFGGFIHAVVEALDSARINYMIGGAVAVLGWGIPRATMDLDIVIEIGAEDIFPLSEELRKRDMLIPADIILDVLIEDRTDLPINAIHMFSGFKADLYLVKPEDDLRNTAFKRRKLVDLGGKIVEVYLHSPEDLVIYKLIYYSLSFQTKHLRDISAILHELDEELDRDYLDEWTARKGVGSLWEGISNQTSYNEEII